MNENDSSFGSDSAPSEDELTNKEMKSLIENTKDVNIMKDEIYPL